MTNPKATYHGMATVCKNKRKQFNKMHLCIKNKIDCVYLKRSIIEADKFYDGLSTYVHEMSHMFGGDASENFSLGLTLAMGRLTCVYEMAVKMRDSKDFDLNSIAKYTKLPIKTILVL